MVAEAVKSAVVNTIAVEATMLLSSSSSSSNSSGGGSSGDSGGSGGAAEDDAWGIFGAASPSERQQ